MAKPTQEGIQVHRRPAEIGDICVLIEPKSQEQHQIHERQHALQARFGGRPIERLHLTCQRFACDDPHQLKRCVDGLHDVVAQTQGFPLLAIAFVTLYVPVRETNILKWQIEVDEVLRQFMIAVREVLVAEQIEPHYLPGFAPDLVAALKDVPDISEVELLKETGFPYPLFETGQLVVSRILGPNEFRIEDVVLW